MINFEREHSSKLNTEKSCGNTSWTSQENILIFCTVHGNAYALKCTVPIIPYNMMYLYKIIYHIRRDLISVTPSQVKVVCKYLNLGTRYVLLFFSYLKRYIRKYYQQFYL
jgi:hypothetical protein